MDDGNCADCNGRGYNVWPDFAYCPSCNGTGLGTDHKLRRRVVLGLTAFYIVAVVIGVKLVV